MSHRILPAALILLLLSVSSANAGGKNDAEQIVGMWRISNAEIDGKNPLPPFMSALMRWDFEKDGRVIIRIAGTPKEEKGSYKLPGAGQIDVTNALAMGSVVHCALRFDSKDQFSICFSIRGKEMPVEFSGAAGKGQALLVLQRVKPGEENPTPAERAKFKDDIDKLLAQGAANITINNLKNLVLAMHIYHDAGRTLPRNAIYSQDGKTPLLSWRVAILPYLGEEALYKEFKLEEPWDSAHNQKLIAKMPRVFRAHDATDGATTTPFQVFTGPNTVFGADKGFRLVDITAGTSFTIFIVEAKTRVTWTQPQDLTLPKGDDKLPALGGTLPREFYAALGDGTVHPFPLSISAAELRGKINPAGK